MNTITPGRKVSPLLAGLLILLTISLQQSANAQTRPDTPPQNTADSARTSLFETQVRPLLASHCARCHNADKMTSGIRVDQIAGIPEDRHLALLADIRKQIESGAMPPEDELQLKDEERSQITSWIDLSIRAAREQGARKNGAMRRLTIAQYRHSLTDLLGIQEDLTDSLPADAISKDGFTNNAALMTLSPLQSEAWFEIAQRALDQCIVDESAIPVVQTFRMDLGRSINPDPSPDNLILGANSELIPSTDFLVTELAPDKTFPYQPWQMQRSFDFIEGYVGNDTIRQWRHFEGLAHSVFAGQLDVSDENMSAPLLARGMNTWLFAAISAIAFTTVLGTVSGLILAAAGAVAHDLLGSVLKLQMSDTEKVRVAKMSSVLIGAVAIVLGILFQKMNPTFLVGWAFSVAASANLPSLVMILFWPRVTKQGIVAAILVGMVSSLTWILLSGEAYSKVYGLDAAAAVVPFSQPGILTIPLGFLTLVVVSLLTPKPVSRVQ